MTKTNTTCTGCKVPLYRDSTDDDLVQPWCGSCYGERDHILDVQELTAKLKKVEAEPREYEGEKDENDDVMTAQKRQEFWAKNPHACPIHFGASTACGQCHGSLKQHLENATNALRNIDFWLDEWGTGYCGTPQTNTDPAKVAEAARAMGDAMHKKLAEDRAEALATAEDMYLRAKGRASGTFWEGIAAVVHILKTRTK